MTPPRPAARRRTRALVAVLPLVVLCTATPANAAPPTYRAATSAGGGTTALATGVAATAAQLTAPRGIAVGRDGALYVADTAQHVVVRVSGGTTTVVAGVVGQAGAPADGKLADPTGVAVDASGAVYVADTGNDVVVKTVPATTPTAGSTAGGTLTVVAGTGAEAPPLNGTATASPLHDPTGIAVDGSGTLWIADTGNNQVEKVAGTTLTIVAGTGRPAAAVPGATALTSPLNAPQGVAVDARGAVHVADTGNRSVQQIGTDGLVSVLATGVTATGIAVDTTGTVLVADPTGSVRQVTSGTATAVPLADGATLTAPRGVAVDAAGVLHVAETGAARVRTLTDTTAAAAPRVVSTPPSLVPLKTAWSTTFRATGNPAPTWSVLGTLPTGLTLNRVTGVLSGTATTAGSSTVTVRAENVHGHDDQVVTLAVTTLAAAPTGVTAVAGDGRAVVSWTAPKDTTGTGAVTGYVVVPTAGGVALPAVTVPAGTTRTVVTGLTNGVAHTFTVAATTSAGTGAASTASTAVTPYATVTRPEFDDKLYRWAGKDRYSTAVTASTAMFPTKGSARAVVVTAAGRYADALAGARLASAASGPLLLTDTDALTAATATEIARVLAPGGTVYVLGGTGVVSTATATSLAALSPNVTVRRIAGEDRYDTAALVAAEVAAVAPGTTTAPVYLASGTNYPDGLAVSALAARTGGVVLLTDGPLLPTATARYLAAADPQGSRVVAVGGAAASAASVLPAAGGAAARSIVGTDRYATSRLVAERFTTTPGAPVHAVGLATGENWPDALAGAAAMGLIGGPVLLTGSGDLHPEARAALTTLGAADRLTTGFVLGGTPSVPAAAASTFGGYLVVD